MAPVGLYTASMGLDRIPAFRWGCASAAITHSHPTGQIAAGSLAFLVHELVLGRELHEAIDDLKGLLSKEDSSKETLLALHAAESLAASDQSPEECLPQLGQGWVAEETLAIGVFCALRARGLEEGIVMAVNITGDSDSTGSVTGNLLGALLGFHEIPARWLKDLELKEVITDIANDLSTVGHWPRSEPPRSTPEEDRERAYWLSKYPG